MKSLPIKSLLPRVPVPTSAVLRNLLLSIFFVVVINVFSFVPRVVVLKSNVFTPETALFSKVDSLTLPIFVTRETPTSLLDLEIIVFGNDFVVVKEFKTLPFSVVVNSRVYVRD